MGGTGVERSGAGGKILVAVTVLGAVAIVVAIAVFSLTGSGFGADLLRGITGSVLGMTTMLLSTRSPRSGRHIAALLLLITFVGSLAFLLLQIALLYAGVGEGNTGTRFVGAFLGFAMGASLARVMGINPMGTRGDQASRRRV